MLPPKSPTKDKFVARDSYFYYYYSTKSSTKEMLMQKEFFQS